MKQASQVRRNNNKNSFSKKGRNKTRFAIEISKEIPKLRFLIIAFQVFVVSSLLINIAETDALLEASGITAAVAAKTNFELMGLEEKESIRLQVEEMIDAAYADHRNLLRNVDKVSVAVDDIDFLAGDRKPSCGGHVLGAHANGEIIIRDAGKEMNEHTLHHEIGHSVWGQLTAEQKGTWTQLYANTQQFLNPYAATNPNENFAENFACSFTDLKGCQDRMHAEKSKFIEKVIELG